MTEWRAVPGYEGRYEISNDGGLWSLRAKTVMTPYRLKSGYLAVGLWDGERRRTHNIHRLVALTFLPPAPSNTHEVCHGDGDQINNAVGNLRWGTRADNMRDAVRHGTHHQSGKRACKRGHPFTPDNTATNSSGHRRCRICQRTAQANYETKKRAAA